MGSTNEINSREYNTEKPKETSLVKYKLHITLVFADDKSSSANVGDCSIATQFSKGEFSYKDADAGYTLDKKEFSISEESPKGMAEASEEINKFILKKCDDRNVSEVCVNILVPSYSENPVVPRAFLNSYPIKCLQSGYEKLNLKKSNIILYGFDKCELKGSTDKSNNKSKSNNNITTNIVKLSALMSYYVYYYLDFMEYGEMYEFSSNRDQDWKQFFKSVKWEDLMNKSKIAKYVKKRLDNPPAPNNDVKSDSFIDRLWDTLCNIVGLPISFIEAALDYALNYKKHVEDRIYGRIFDVLAITKPKDVTEQYVEGISNHLAKAKKWHGPLGLYDFFEACGYWEYLEDEKLKTECKEWINSDFNVGSSSGYGNVLFSYNYSIKKGTYGVKYICAFKGTDMDSLTKDWILTNVLQGLTGFSAQHIKAADESRKIEEQIAKDKLAEKDKFAEDSIWFTGHSLGGGLASAATLATSNRKGITFNAAGLNVFGVKINQLLHNANRILHPSEDWNRVLPFIIKGEVLDKAQTFIGYAIPILERAYGSKPIEIELSDEKLPCIARHGINNFLYKEVMGKLVVGSPSNKEDNGNNSISEATLTCNDVKMTVNFK